RALEVRRELLTAEPAEDERLRGEIGGVPGLCPRRGVEPDRQAPDEGRRRRRAVVARGVGGPEARRVGPRARLPRVGTGLTRGGCPGAARARDEPLRRARLVEVVGERDAEEGRPAILAVGG